MVRQVQNLVMSEADSCCSAFCTGRFICDEDQSCGSFFVASSIFGNVGGFHLGRRSIMRVMFRGRRNIWSSWSVTFHGRINMS